MAERPKARVSGRSLAGGMDVCVVCCTVRTKGNSQDKQVVERERRKKLAEALRYQAGKSRVR